MACVRELNSAFYLSPALFADKRSSPYETRSAAVFLDHGCVYRSCGGLGDETMHETMCLDGSLNGEQKEFLLALHVGNTKLYW